MTNANTQWQEINLSCQAHATKIIEDWLFAQGALSVTYQDGGGQPILEPKAGQTPLWQRVVVTALFDQDHDISKLIQRALDALADYLEDQPTTRLFDDQDWQASFQQSFEPIAFGDGLWICPSWHTPPDHAHTVLKLDPGLAFGTGSHPTTALCLSWLEQSTDTVIDYGCGSGILAIAAKKLGAQQVIAIDNDPQAIQATLENAEKNDLSGQIQAYLPQNAPEILPQADIVIANILANILIDLAPTFDQSIKSTGTLVLSGILDNQITSIKRAFDSYHIPLNQQQRQGEWYLLSGQRSVNKN